LYWGKAGNKKESECNSYHPLIYHSLDVAAVARAWLAQSPSLICHFTRTAQVSDKALKAWILFFLALHDIGKFDIRFQIKVTLLAKEVYGKCPNPIIARNYWHGEYAAYWAWHDMGERLHWKPDDDEFSFLMEDPPGVAFWKTWEPWIRAVAGHHGMEPPGGIPSGSAPQVSSDIITQDHEARLSFIRAMEKLFLEPAGLTLEDEPPQCNLEFLAGFCSVCDWLGSTTENAEGKSRFDYVTEPMPLEDYLNKRLPIAERLLQESGLLVKTVTQGGMKALFPQFDTPHQVQTLVDDLPVKNGLTLIEAPTGSGKTEAALAYAARLLAAGKAESIIFALPTQATADAMLERITEIAGRLFDDPDVVLAHGKSRFNPKFIDLKKAAERSRRYPDREQEAGAQCALWLAQSRKRVFLGQIGVCTIDQVLVSALPVRHRFVRGFGLGKSVLIIDEVHAYDAYMYALMDKVLRQQNAVGGSTILLSATLPLPLRQRLLQSWDADTGKLSAENDYPLITQVQGGEVNLYPLPDSELSRLTEEETPRQVELSWLETDNMLPDETMEQRIIDAADAGANVVIICNLVADAQQLHARLSDRTNKPVLLFHSRYRFKDRQSIQEQVMRHWGKKKPRLQGGILVATQVVEQSLDLDFDWMLTQLCPIDLLFQRLGRLHRHERPRPAGFEHAACTVLLPPEQRYELHKVIYGNGKAPNSRVLWRTEQMVRQHPEMTFPEAYRPLIEKVYEDEPWPDEPEEIAQEYEKFWQAEDGSRAVARYISNIENAFDDNDDNVSLLTRDGEMSLNILPIIETDKGRCFLDNDQPIAELEAWQQAEQIMRNTLPAPRSWQGLGLPEPSAADGLIWLPMQTVDGRCWRHHTDKATFTYDTDRGLKMEKS